MRKAIFLLHGIITLAFTFLPILFSWWINVIIYSVWIVHLIIFGGCVLTIFEYGKDSKTTFGEELLKKLHVQMTPENYRFFSNYIQAPLCITLSLIWQELLGIEPLFF
jgi:hypothetical protein